MELYVLDGLLRRTTVVDSFDSVIWTERYNDVGDMTLNIHSSQANRNLLTTGTLLAMNLSSRVMMIETVEDKSDSSGNKTLILTGSSIEIILEDRVARDSVSTGETIEPKWVITGLPADIARQIFQSVMVNGILDAFDILPFYAPGNLYPADTLPEPSTVATVSLPLGTVLSSLKLICKTYDLGFRIVRNLDNSQLLFNVYSGNDRTTGQSALPAVVFAANLDNLINSTYLTSIKLYKNVAYVFCPDAATKAYSDSIDPTTSGFGRRILMVEAQDIKYPIRTYTVTSDQQSAIRAAMSLATSLQPAQDALNRLVQKVRLLAGDANIIIQSAAYLSASQSAYVSNAISTSQAYEAGEYAALLQVLEARGIQELAKHNSITAFDGEIPKTGSYVYEVDYRLGDITEIRNQDGVVTNVRVTEQIFSQDRNGEKSYPTLSSRLVITPGVWFSWDANQHWIDVVDTQHWGDLV